MTAREALEAQRRRARERANRVRSQRAEVKRRIAAGVIDLVHLLDGEVPGESAAEGVAVEQLLRAVPGVGRTTAAEILGGLGIPGPAALSTLTPDQRRALAAAVEDL